MKVVLDGRIVIPRMTGAGRYVIELARHLPAVGANLDLTVLLRPNMRDTSVPGELSKAGVSVHYVAARVARMRQWVVLPVVLRALDPDLYHYPFLDMPFVHCPSIVTVYDLNPLLHPEYFNRFRAVQRRIFTMLCASTLRRCRIALAISDSTRTLVERHYHVAPGKVRTVPLGVDPLPWAPGAASASAGPPDPNQETPWTTRRYMLYVGVDRPHKNLVHLVRGFAAFRERAAWRAGAGPYLWLAGVGTGSVGLQEAIRSLGLERDVRLDGPIAESALPALYRGAVVFAYVSTSEGFGLPVLEAFAAGVPVVTSTTTSLPEVGGDAVEYIDPESDAEIAGALARLWDDETRGRSLVELGRRRVLQFSWEATAIGTYRAYEDALRGSPSGA